jgi:hypothetical protein
VTAYIPVPLRTTSENTQGEPVLKYPEWIHSKAVQYGETTSVATQPSILTLRSGRDPEKAPVKSVSTRIRNQRKEPRIFIALKRNPFFSKQGRSLDNILIFKICCHLFLSSSLSKSPFA